MLFVLFINDLPDATAACGIPTAVYADDTKIYRSLSKKSDSVNVQLARSNLAKWKTTTKTT